MVNIQWPQWQKGQGIGLDRFDAETMGSNMLKAWMFVLVYSSSLFTCHQIVDTMQSAY
jgi:hypothetical protein